MAQAPVNPKTAAPAKVAAGGMGLMDKVMNFGLMAPMLVGFFFSRPAQFLYEKTGSKAVYKFAEATRFDQSQSSLKEIGTKVFGKVEAKAPGIASGFTSATVKVEQTLAKTKVGESIAKQGGLASSVENVLKPVGGNKVANFIADLNRKGMKSNFETMQSNFKAIYDHVEKTPGLKGHPDTAKMLSQIKAIEQKAHSPEAVLHGLDGMHGEMKGILGKLDKLHGAALPKDSGMWNSLRRNVGSAAESMGDIGNKGLKIQQLEGGLGKYLSGLPSRMGSWTPRRAAMGLGMAAGTAFAVKGSISEGKADRKEYDQTAQEFGLGPNAKGKAVPMELQAMHKELNGTRVNTGINVLGGLVSQALIIRGGTSLKGMGGAIMAQMGISAAAGIVAPKSKTAEMTRTMREQGKPATAGQFVDLFCSVNPQAAKTGIYSATTQVRADHMALYAEANNMTPGAALAMAARARTDADFAKQITASAEQIVAQKKAAASQPQGIEQMADLNPMAKTGHVKNLQMRNAMSVGTRANALA